MKNIYIRNHDIYAVVLEYKPSAGPIRQVERSKISNELNTEKGFYVEINDIFVGVFASKLGPIFFYNNKEYILADEGFRAFIEKQVDEYVFILKYYDEEKVKIKYTPIKHKDYDSWSNEEFVDFFVWFTDSLSKNRESFVQYRTLL